MSFIFLIQQVAMTRIGSFILAFSGLFFLQHEHATTKLNVTRSVELSSNSSVSIEMTVKCNNLC